MDMEWLLANWTILAGSGAALVVLVVVALLARPKNPAPGKRHQKTGAQSRTKATETMRAGSSGEAIAPARESTAASPVNLFYQAGRGMQGGWVTLQGVPVAADSQSLRLSPGANAISVQSAPIAQGDEFVCDYEVRLVVPASNGGPVNFHVGAVVRDASGAVVRYWIAQEAFSAGETVRKGRTVTKAPDGAATVHLGAHGSWLRDKTHGDGVVEFESISVRSKS